jgi:hypothetical protein
VRLHLLGNPAEPIAIVRSFGQECIQSRVKSALDILDRSMRRRGLFAVCCWRTFVIRWAALKFDNLQLDKLGEIAVPALQARDPFPRNTEVAAHLILVEIELSPQGKKAGRPV